MMPKLPTIAGKSLILAALTVTLASARTGSAKDDPLSKAEDFYQHT
jgi:hypothetical protein